LCLNPSGVRRSFQVPSRIILHRLEKVSTPPESGGHFKEVVNGEYQRIPTRLNPSGVRRSFQGEGVQNEKDEFLFVSTPPESGGHFKAYTNQRYRK